MKDLNITLHDFADKIKNENITKLRSINIMQVILIFPYFGMFYFLFIGHSPALHSTNVFFVLTIINVLLFPVFLLFAKHIFNNILHHCDYPKIYLLRKKVPFYKNKSDIEMYILEIQKAYNIFFFLLDLYSLFGLILLIRVIKTGIIYQNIQLWINIIPFICTIIIALYKFPTKERVIQLFIKYIINYTS